MGAFTNYFMKGKNTLLSNNYPSISHVGFSDAANGSGHYQ